MRVLFVSESLSLSKNTGVSSTLVSYARSLTQDLDIELLAPLEFTTQKETKLYLEGLTTHLFLQNRLLPRTFVPELTQFLVGNLTRFDLVHIHGLWRYPQWAAAHYARKLNIPYIISPHGMCEPYELAHKGWKKKIYFNLIEMRSLQAAAAIHAISEAEQIHCSQLKISSTIEVIPHGVLIPEELPASQIEANLPMKMLSIPQKSPVILYMGRLHPKKGLEILLPAFLKLLSQHPSAYLVIAGPDVDGYQDTLGQLGASYKINEQLIFLGMVTGIQKQAMLQRADVFTLPSFSEGFSVAILEALAAAKPVVITKQCYFEEVVNIGCGWVVEANILQLANALNSILEMSPSMRTRMGQLGRNLVEQKYTWELAVKKMKSLYQNISPKSKIN